MRELRPLLAAALHPQWTIGLVHWGIAWTRKLPEASPTLATLFSREREECVPHFDGSDASLLDAGSSLFFANLFARRRRASASKPALGTRSGLTHRVVTGSERADVVARTAVVRIRRRIAAARIGVRRRGVDAGVACSIDIPRTTHPFNTSVRGRHASRFHIALAACGADRAIPSVASTAETETGHDRRKETDVNHRQEIVDNQRVHGASPRRPRWHAGHTTAMAPGAAGSAA